MGFDENIRSIDQKLENDLRHIDRKRTKRIQSRIRIITTIVLILLAFFLIYGYRKQWFTSARPIADFFQAIGIFGYIGAAGFIVFNAVFPIIPGALPSLAMFMAYGPVVGFISVLFFSIVGSVLSFLVSRRYGETFVKAFVPDSLYDSLISKIRSESSATKMLILAYLIPGLPDDATTMIIGLTEMRLSRFIWINCLSKPLPTFAYLFGISSLLEWLFHLVTRL